MRFAIGVVLGTAALSFLWVDRSYALLWLLLGLASFTLLKQAGGLAKPEETFTSDADAWRSIGRGFVEGWPTAVVQIVPVAILIFLWDPLADRYPFIKQVPYDLLALIVLTACWIVLVIEAFRSGLRGSQQSQV